MRARSFITTAFVAVLVLGLTGNSERQGPFTEEYERARAELIESQNRARLHDEREFLPRTLPEEVHLQIEREFLDTWHAVGLSLLICIALLIFLLPLFARERH